MIEFIYNNIKNTSTSHIFFKFNYEYYPYVSIKKTLILIQNQKS